MYIQKTTYNITVYNAKGRMGGYGGVHLTVIQLAVF